MLNSPFGNTVDALAPTSCGVPNKNGCAIPFADPWSYTPGGDPLKAINYPTQGQPVTLPQSDVTFPQQGVYVSMPIHVTPMQVTQWNVSYQRQFPLGLLVDVTYMGNKTTHIWSGFNENPAVYIPGNCEAGEYRAHQGRAVLEHFVGKSPGAGAADAAQPHGGQLLSGQQRQPDLRQRKGLVPRRETWRAEAPG